MTGSVFDFNAIARRYDRWYEDPVGRTYDRLEKAAVERLLDPAEEGGVTLLEVGSGTGHWSDWFSGKGYRVTGIDISGEMIRMAGEKNIPGARFLQGDFLEADIAETFDIVAAVTSLEFIPEPEKALSKMVSLLKPGGRILIGVLNRRSWLGFVRKLRGDKNPVYRPARFFSRAELRSLLGAYGSPRVEGAAFIPPCKPFLRWADVLEGTGRCLCPWAGNFLAAMVRVP